jgi:alcohol dehydrogenase class IV
VLQLREELSIPPTLAALNVTADRTEQLARMAEKDPSASGNPRPFDAAAARQVLEAAFEGRIATG